MHGTAHRLTAATGWWVTANQVGLPWWQQLAGVGIAAAFSAGPTSPDLDNAKTWKRLDRIVKDEVLGDGGPLGHRELLHWWGLPAAAAIALYVAGGPWYAWAAVLGWVSHLAGDFVFGMPGYGTPVGIPLGPWWWHVGLGLRSGGLIERALVPLACVGAVAGVLYLGWTP